MDQEEKDLIRENVREVLAAAGGDDARSAVDAFGWEQFLAEEPAAAVEIFASVIGELISPAAVIDDVVARAAGLDLRTGTAVVYPRAGSLTPTSSLVHDGASYRLEIDGIVRTDATGEALVPAVIDGNVALVTVRGGVDWPRSGSGLDENSGWARLVVALQVGEADVLAGSGAQDQWAAMRAAGHRALAHEMIGVGRAILQLTLDHVTAREQFGKPLAAFQVVKHKLADIRLWQEPAQLAAEAAWEDESAESAALAKLLAARFLETCRINGQQLLGGMGFTWEHPFHWHMKRALLLESLLGSRPALRAHLGSLVREASLPSVALL